MTDRELLELAAKAAEMHPDHWQWNGYGIQELAVHGVPHCGFQGPEWNPLTDDGDALRLAVKFLFEIDMGRGCISVRHSTGIKILEAFNQDPYAATRRAIVRAAAEIGRNMK